LAIYNNRVLASVNPVEYVFYHFQNSRPGGIERSPNLGTAIKRFNEESHWVAAEITLPAKAKDQAALIGKFIRTADHSVHLGNFFSLFAILGALCFPAVTRLRTAWEKVPDKLKRLQSDLEGLMNPSRNMKAYRAKLNEVAADQMRVPCLPLHLKDILFAGEAGQTVEGAAVNMEKLTMVARCIAPLVVSPASATLRADHALQAYIQVSTVDPEATVPVSTGIPNSPATSRRNVLKAVKELLKTSYASEHSRQAEVNESLIGSSADFSLDLSSVRKRRFPFARKPDLFPFGKKSTAAPDDADGTSGAARALGAGHAAGASAPTSASARQNAERRRKFLIRKLTSPPKKPATRTRDTESVARTAGGGNVDGDDAAAEVAGSMQFGSESDVETDDESPSMVLGRSTSEPIASPNRWGDQSIAELSESPGPAGSRGTAGGFTTPQLGRASLSAAARPSPLNPAHRNDAFARTLGIGPTAESGGGGGSTDANCGSPAAAHFNSSFLRAVGSEDAQTLPLTPLHPHNKPAATDHIPESSLQSSMLVQKSASPAVRTSTPSLLATTATATVLAVPNSGSFPIEAADWSKAVKRFETQDNGDNSILETSYIEINDDTAFRTNGFTYTEA